MNNEKFPLKILMFLENKDTIGGGGCGVCDCEKCPRPVGGSGGILPGKKCLNTYLNGANVKYFERIKARFFITEYIEKYYTRTSITNMERYVR